LLKKLVGSDKLWGMPARKRPAANNHLQEAMALLIRNQAAFVEQIARNDQERLTLQRKSDVWQLKNDERWRKTEEWQRRSEERFDRIEERLSRVETILLQLPKAIKKEIGFKVQR
jgi:oligoendopeptidase F